MSSVYEGVDRARKAAFGACGVATQQEKKQFLRHLDEKVLDGDFLTGTDVDEWVVRYVLSAGVAGPDREDTARDYLRSVGYQVDDPEPETRRYTITQLLEIDVEIPANGVQPDVGSPGHPQGHSTSVTSLMQSLVGKETDRGATVTDIRPSSEGRTKRIVELS